jgi:hypothetical protein
MESYSAECPELVYLRIKFDITVEKETFFDMIRDRIEKEDGLSRESGA